MRVGVALPANGPHASPAFLRRVAQRAERLGYDSVWCSDHVTWSVEDAVQRFPAWAAEVGPEAVEPHQYEPVATLGYLAGATDRVRLGTAVLVLPVRNPVILAKQVAHLDQLSGGRVVLGVGVGGTVHADADFGAAGLSELKPHRGRATDEWLEVLRQVWTQPTFSYHGELIDVRDASIHPKPRQPGGPPILIGGDSPHALRRVARYADGSIVSRLAPSQVAGRRRELADLAGPYGRADVRFQLVASQWLAIAGDERTAVERADRALGGAKRGGRSLAGKHPNLVGTAARIQELVGEYAAAGVDELMLQVIGDSEEQVLESLQHFSEDVRAGVP